MYFAVDLDNRVITTETDVFTVKQFKEVIDRASTKGKSLDMTLMTQRFVSMSYDFDALIEFYNTN